MIHQFELPIIVTIQAMGENMQPFWKAITILGDEAFYLVFMPLVYWCVNALAGFGSGGHAPAERFDQRLSQDDPQEPPPVLAN